MTCHGAYNATDLRDAVAYYSPASAIHPILLWAADEIERLGKCLSDATSKAEALQAKVDELMLEYCPDEMTPEQTAEWARHQVPSRPGGTCPHCQAVYLTGTGLARHLAKYHPDPPADTPVTGHIPPNDRSSDAP